MQPGTTIDHYEIGDKIGEGGMGAVYRARDTTLDRDVAIKVLPPSFTADEGRLARFEQEAKAVAALSHPNIVTIYGFGTSDGVTYAAMELLEGSSLRELMDAGALPLRKAIDIAGQVAAGLDAAHARGIVHRDLKPDNVFVTPDGRARILDFGLALTREPSDAAVSEESGTLTRLTNPGTIVGTAGYMSPEQARGTEAGPATDLFALGVMLHEMLSGEHPFVRETAAETLTAILREEPAELTVDGAPAPAALARIVRRCLEKSPEERFRSGSDLAFALESSLADSGASQPAMAPAMGAPTRAPSAWGRNLAVVAAGVLAFAAGWLLRPEPGAVEPPRVKELTFTGQDSQSTVSPDERLIAFTSTRTGVSRIWLRQTDGGIEQPLTEGSDFRPVFSPDSQSVAFIRRDDDVYSAYRIPVLGGQPRKLVEDVIEVSFSPDGRSLAFLRGSRVATGGTQLGILDLESGSERIVTGATDRNLLGAAWSDDGSRIATTRTGTQGASGDWNLLVTDVATGTINELSAGNARLSAPVWAGNDALIYAESFTTVSSSPEPERIVRRDLQTGEERVLLWEPYLFALTGVRAAASQVNLLGNDQLVFDTYRQAQTLYEVDTESGETRLISDVRSVDRQPSYAPDGSRLLFTSNRSGNVDLFSYEFATGLVTQLTDHPASDWDGAYTPDGESIIWSSDRGGNLEIWMADADGSNPRQITYDSANAENPTMTPDGEWIVYLSGRSDASGIYKIRSDGTDETLLLEGTWTNPEVSHDGRLALAIRNDPGVLINEVAIVEVETGERVDFRIQIEYVPESDNVAYGRGRWMPNDEAIAFVGVGDDDQPTVWIQDFVPGQDTRATRRQPPGIAEIGVIESLGLSPDGSRIAVSQLGTARVLKMAEGVGPLR